MRIVVATHGHCFDGLASATLFTALAKAVESKTPTFRYHACAYAPKQHETTPALFDGDANALLDFQFSPSTNLTWYFDHHATAFPSPAAREFFDSRVATGRFHYDSASGSCATVIARAMREDFGLSLGILQPLVELADRVDTAQYGSASEAIDRSTPASRLVALVERHGNDAFLARWIPRLLSAPVDVVANDPEVARDFAEIDREQLAFLDHVRTRAVPRGPVIYVDLTDRIHSTFAKFVTYALFPKSTYSVVVGRIPGATRLSVGYNPWSGEERRHNLGALCQTYGGGGHPVVGGVAFPDEAVERARSVALSLVQVLADG